MIREERLRLIREWIDREKSVNVGDLQERLGVSLMTVWRDLEALEKNGVLTRVRGGAIKKEIGLEIEPFFELKQTIYSEKKELIARYAARHFVRDNNIIILEGGTTIAHMVPYLLHNNLTIITNGLNTLMEVEAHLCRSTVLACGGMLREPSHTLVGPQAEAFFSGVRSHKFFLGGTGINPEDGLTDPSLLEIQVKRAMHKSAEQTILLLDSSKFGVRSLAPILPLEEIDILVTDPDAPPDMLANLREIGLDIHIADVR